MPAHASVKLINSGKSEEIKLDYSTLRKSVLVLRSLNHKLRQQIIKLLEETENITVTDIYKKMRLEQSVASQHLAILKRAGVVSTQRQGRFIYYTLNRGRLKEIGNMIYELTASS